MMMNDGVDDEIEDSGGDDDERRWWKFVSGGVDDEIEDSGGYESLFPVWFILFCFVSFCIWFPLGV